MREEVQGNKVERMPRPGLAHPDRDRGGRGEVSRAHPLTPGAAPIICCGGR